jgi:hypothetical protein
MKLTMMPRLSSWFSCPAWYECGFIGRPGDLTVLGGKEQEQALLARGEVRAELSGLTSAAPEATGAVQRLLKAQPAHAH